MHIYELMFLIGNKFTKYAGSRVVKNQLTHESAKKVLFLKSITKLPKEKI